MGGEEGAVAENSLLAAAACGLTQAAAAAGRWARSSMTERRVRMRSQGRVEWAAEASEGRSGRAWEPFVRRRLRKEPRGDTVEGAVVAVVGGGDSMEREVREEPRRGAGSMVRVVVGVDDGGRSGMVRTTKEVNAVPAAARVVTNMFWFSESKIW